MTPSTSLHGLPSSRRESRFRARYKCPTRAARAVPASCGLGTDVTVVAVSTPPCRPGLSSTGCAGGREPITSVASLMTTSCAPNTRLLVLASDPAADGGLEQATRNLLAALSSTWRRSSVGSMAVIGGEQVAALPVSVLDGGVTRRGRRVPFLRALSFTFRAVRTALILRPTGLVIIAAEGTPLSGPGAMRVMVGVGWSRPWRTHWV